MVEHRLLANPQNFGKVVERDSSVTAGSERIDGLGQDACSRIRGVHSHGHAIDRRPNHQLLYQLVHGVYQLVRYPDGWS